MRTSLYCSLALLAGCSVRAVTPAARALPLDTPTTPAVGAGDVQVDGSAVGFMMGAGTLNGGLRYRHRLAPTVSAEVDGGVIHVVESHGDVDPNGYTGRAGVLIQRADDSAVRAVASLGVGGGYAPTAGSWATVDVGGMISGAHRLVRPFLGGDIVYANAIDHPTFRVGEGDDATDLQLPDTMHLRATAGVEFGTRDVSVLVGATLDGSYAMEQDQVGSNGDTFRDVAVGLGLGLRVATE